jgi:hypothetical protein
MPGRAEHVGPDASHGQERGRGAQSQEEASIHEKRLFMVDLLPSFRNAAGVDLRSYRRKSVL